MSLVQPTTIDYETYAAFVLENPERRWELYRGQLREKPDMAARHNRDQRRLDKQLNRQLDELVYEVSSNSARLRAPSGAVFIPDVAVVPAALVDLLDGSPALETYDEPMPFVAEVWSPSTGDYDVETKLGEYRARGDREIWRIHPHERTVTVWRRQDDGSYVESLHTGGLLTLWALPNVTIDLDALLR
jgi:Uma2 family endonuclease